MSNCLLCEIDPATNNTFIRGYDYWNLLLNFKQPTLGSSLIVLKRHKSFLSEITDQEAQESIKIIREYERAIKDSFNPKMINHLMLANTVPHVHYHCVPRYENTRSFAGQEWIDSNYGSFPFLKTDEKNQGLLSEIIFKIRKKL